MKETSNSYILQYITWKALSKSCWKLKNLACGAFCGNSSKNNGTYVADHIVSKSYISSSGLRTILFADVNVEWSTFFCSVIRYRT